MTGKSTFVVIGAGLVVDNGIVVDSFGRSSDEHIFAAGDVANQNIPLKSLLDI